MTKILTCYLPDVNTFNGRFKWLWKEKPTLRKKKEAFLETLRTYFKQQQEALHKVFPKKRMEMLDYVIYNLVATGIQAIQSKTLMEKFDVSQSTVSRFVKSLKATPFMIVARYIKEDTTGAHPDSYVFILKSHKNFDQICEEIFFAHDTTGIQTLQQEEMTTPVTTPVTSPESAENVDTPSFKDEKASSPFINLDLPVNHINNHLISASQSFAYIKGVPKKVNHVYAGKYGHQLKDFYARIQNAAKAVKRDTEIEIIKEQVHEVAYTAIVGLDKYVHEANHKGTPLSLDEMCRLVYQIAYNQFTNLLKGNTEEHSSESDIHTEAETALFTPKHIIRKELVPAWLQAEQEQKERTQGTALSLDEQLEMIQLKQDLGQELTPDEENVLQDHSTTYSSLEMAQLKQDLGQALTPEEQALLQKHAQLQDTVS
ncbi:replication protein [Priestia megaterium]|uniref:Replication protein n=1 Tax=Priestia megaterium TaxID=1404 RepID=A0AAE5P200_PRIMG|nr:replication protein [Priestia megaterium]MDR4222191.1 replication protein [Priestia megaterium]MED4234938.1 replication protein [Priestia megaterium]PES29549.1 replication protein [Priestia megaterium]PFJ40295.1 replication protein [Priestia megaterium]PGH75058.1 replication protein [Priestia megaterium]